MSSKINEPPNTLIREKSLEFMFSKPKQFHIIIKSDMSLSHIKTRHGYDFLLYFPCEFLMNLRNRNK